MRYKVIFRLLGILLLLFSPSMLTPLIINAIFHEQVYLPFLAAFFCTFATGMTLWLCFHQHRYELRIRDGFLFVALFWFVLCFFASLPFLLTIPIDNIHQITDAIFETVSGITTTGASVVPNVYKLPHAILFYRQQLQFLGGIGIIVLAVAVLPMLGVGGMQLYRAEVPGPMKDAKLTPRITQTAKALWSTYCALTLACALCYWLLGMTWFEAIGESFGTVSTGGFSVHNASFGYYKSDALRLVACLFMLLGSTNFALHFIAVKKFSLRGYFRDEEFKYYTSALLLISGLIMLSLCLRDQFPFNTHTAITSLFTIVSFASTTGFDLEPISSWPVYISFLIILLMIVGGCAASTSGGIKVLRASLIAKQSRRELKRLLHPHAIIPIKLGGQTLPESVMQSMWGFISIFIMTYLALMLIFMSLGHDFPTACAAVTAGLANAGASTGSLSVSFSALDIPSKWVLIFSMLIGRLEICSILILFTRQFWEK